MKNAILQIYNNEKLLEEIAVPGKDNKRVLIKALDGVNYSFYDTWLESPPNHLVTKREGQDLIVYFTREAEDSELVIQNFFDNKNQSFIGKTENGDYYNYIPDTGEVEDYLTLLQDNQVEGYALGGKKMATPFWKELVVDNEESLVSDTDTLFTFLPFLGLGLVPFIFAGKSSSRKDRDSEPSEDTSTTDTMDNFSVNLTENNPHLDKASLQIAIDDTFSNECIVENQGIWNVNNTSGSVTFTPKEGFSGEPSPVNYKLTKDGGNTTEGLIIYDTNGQVQGGEGTDILILSSALLTSTLDFTHVSNIEKIDINNDTADTFTITAADVLSITNNNNTLFIDTDSNDAINGLSDFTQGTSNPDYAAYTVYTATVDSQEVTLYVDNAIV